MPTLNVFSEEQQRKAKLLLSAKVATMMGRKLEEGDWSEVYHAVRGVQDPGWSNLHIDYDHDGLGIEFKMIRSNRTPLRDVCGTTLMHPSATRSIDPGAVDRDPNEAMFDVFQQYAELIEGRADRVRESSSSGSADMRFGWLIWEPNLTDFLYFEEPMVPPDPVDFYAVWNERKAQGSRKASTNLWVFRKSDDKKRYSITTGRGAKIQPYFDVPPPSDPNLVHMRVQSEYRDDGTVVMWVTHTTHDLLRRAIGDLTVENVSKAVEEAVEIEIAGELTGEESEGAYPVPVSLNAFNLLVSAWDAVSDEHRVQLLVQHVAEARRQD